MANYEIPDEPENHGIFKREKEYDERQCLTRYKISHQCYLLSLLGLFIFKECSPRGLDWQSQYLPFLCFSFAVLDYYTIACIFQDAYFTPKQNKHFYQFMFLDIFAALCWYFLYFSELRRYQNDLKTAAEVTVSWVPQYPWISLLIAISATLIAIAMIIKQILIFRAEKEEQ